MPWPVSAVRTAAAAAIIVILRAGTTPAQNSDSLSYLSLRNRVALADSVSQVLATADALAEAGLYAEAAEILAEHASARDTVDTAGLHAPARTVRWRISIGIDYYHLEDVDTAVMTPEELRDYRRLTETPRSVWLCAKATVQPLSVSVEEIGPEIYASERKARASAAARLSSFGGILRYEPLLKVEKWFRADASGESPFEPTASQPSDMAGAALQVTAGNTTYSEGRLRWAAPLSVGWEHYRADRPGYESRLEYRFMPSLELRAPSQPFHGRLSGQLEYEDYYRAGSDSLDVLRLSARGEASARIPKVTSLLSGAWMGDRYAHASSPEAIDRFEAEFRGEYQAVKFLTVRLRIRGIHERERYGPDSGATAFGIDGSELTVEPVIETSIGAHVRIGPGVRWERRWAGRNAGLFLWEARSAWEPGFSLEGRWDILEASVRGSFRAEDINVAYESYTADNRSVRLGADMAFMPVRALSFNLFADYQYRIYSPYGFRARVSENVTVSAIATVKFQANTMRQTNSSRRVP